ncbi:MAG: OB-fold nucleic acid binding domain-containing protein [Anaeroplasma sp.]
MKKFLSWISACLFAFTSLFILASCSKDSVKAEDLLATLIIDGANTDITEDFGVPSQIVRGEDTYPLTWESNSEYLTVSEAADENNLYIISVNRPADEQKEVALTVTLEVSQKNKATKEFTFKVSPYDVYDFSSEYKFDKENKNVSRTFSLPTSYTLAGTNQTCTISWESKNTDYITIAEDGKSATAKISFVKVPVKLAATFTYKNESTTKTYTVNCLEQITYTEATTPEENVAYKLGFFQVTLNNTYYWCNGKIATNSSGDFGGATTSLDESVDVYVEKVTDTTWKLYFKEGETKKYIFPTINGTTIRYGIDTDASKSVEWVWNTEYNTFTFDVSGTTYYMGTYSSYNTFSFSKISYAATSYVSHLFKVSELESATPTYTDAEKVQVECDLYSNEETMYPGTNELADKGTKFTDVNVTYAVKDSSKDVASVKDNVLTIAWINEDKTIDLTVTFTLGEATLSKDITISAKSLNLEYSTIAQAIAAENDTFLRIKGVVTAIYSNGYILYDGTDAIQVYTSKTADKDFAWTIGDSVEVIGSKDYYNGHELVPVIASTKLETALDITIPTAEAYDATKLQAYLAGEDYDIIPVIIEGGLILDNGYYNVNVTGLTGQGSIKITTALKDTVDALVDKQVKITGWAYGISKKSINKVSTPYFVNIILTAIEDPTSNYTDEQKVNAEKEAFTMNTTMYSGSYDLVTAGTAFTNVVISYTIKTDESSIASIVDNKLTLATVATPTTVVLTVTFAIEDTTVSKDIEITVSVIEVSTITEALAAEDNTVIRVQGKVVAVSGDGYTNGYVLYDGTEAIYIYAKGSPDSSFAWVIGDSVEVIAKKATSNGDRLIPLYASKAVEPALDITIPTTPTTYVASDIETYLAGSTFDVTYVEITGTVIVSGTYLNLDVEGLSGKQGSLKAAGDVLNDLKNINGKNVKIRAYTYGISLSSGSPKFLNMIVNEVEYIASAADRAVDVVNTAKALISSEAYDVTTNITFKNIYRDVTLTVTLPTDAKTLTYDVATSTLTITPTKDEVTEIINIKAQIGTESNNADVNIKSQLPSTPYQIATLEYTGSGSGVYMTATDNAEKVGLDTELFTVNAAKNDSSNFPALNSAGEIRVYGKEGNGGAFTVSIAKSGYTATITSISITFSSGYSSGAQITVDSSVVEGTDGVYAINASSFELKNINSGTTQVRIKSIEIKYTLVALDA